MKTIRRILLATWAGFFACANFTHAQQAAEVATAADQQKIFIPPMNPEGPPPFLVNAFADIKINDHPLKLSSVDDLKTMLELLQSE